MDKFWTIACPMLALMAIVGTLFASFFINWKGRN